MIPLQVPAHAAGSRRPLAGTTICVKIPVIPRIKRWRRDWKIELIERENPNWNDLYDGIL